MIRLSQLLKEIKSTNKLPIIRADEYDSDESMNLYNLEIPLIRLEVCGHINKNNPNYVILEFLNEQDFGSKQDEIDREKIVKLFEKFKVPFTRVNENQWISFPKKYTDIK